MIEIRAYRGGYRVYVDGQPTNATSPTRAGAQRIVDDILERLGMSETATETLPKPRAVSRGRGSGPPRGVMLANKWTGQDPTGWWMSEKLDGIRAYWDGARLWTRNGNPINAPAWFTRGFPNEELDGELWAGRGNFQDVSSYVRKDRPRDAEWRKIWYLVFAAPQASGPPEKRFAHLERIVAGIPTIRFVEQTRCTGKQQLLQILAAVTRNGGEGVMLLAPNAPYVPRRSPYLLKVKEFQDEEATIIGYEEGKGRHQGRLGAYWARLDDGVEFKIGTGLSDRDRDRRLPLGTRVTVSYVDKTRSGKPKTASFVRVRGRGE